MIGFYAVDFLGKKNDLWHEWVINLQYDVSQTYRTEIYSSLMPITRHRAF